VVVLTHLLYWFGSPQYLYQFLLLCLFIQFFGSSWRSWDYCIHDRCLHDKPPVDISVQWCCSQISCADEYDHDEEGDAEYIEVLHSPNFQ
jgi:hypothetical protein